MTIKCPTFKVRYEIHIEQCQKFDVTTVRVSYRDTSSDRSQRSDHARVLEAPFPAVELSINTFGSDGLGDISDEVVRGPKPATEIHVVPVRNISKLSAWNNSKLRIERLKFLQ